VPKGESGILDSPSRRQSGPSGREKSSANVTAGGSGAAELAAAARRWEQWSDVARQRLIDEGSYEQRAAAALKAVRAEASGGKQKATGSATVVADLLGELQTAALASAHAHVEAGATSRSARAKHGDQQRALVFSRRAVQLCEAALDALEDDASRRKGKAAAQAGSSQLLDALTNAAVTAKRCAALVGSWTSVASTMSSDAITALSSVTVVPTRGKTAPGRLRAVDALLCAHVDWKAWLTEAVAPLLVDLGFGATPATVLDLAEVVSRAVFRRIPSSAALRPCVLGVEADRDRARLAREWLQRAQLQAQQDKAAVDAPESTPMDSGGSPPSVTWGLHRRIPPGVDLNFRCGGFALPLEEGEHGRLAVIKAMNVLRQYDIKAAEKAHKALLLQLRPAGVLLEGSSDPRGNLAAVWMLSRPVAESHKAPRASLVFLACIRSSVARAEDNGRFFSPCVFLRDDGLREGGEGERVPVLPRSLWEQRKERGTKISRFLELWTGACMDTRERVTWAGAEGQAVDSARTHFVVAARLLAVRLSAAGLPGIVVTRRSWLQRGILCWEGVPYC